MLLDGVLFYLFAGIVLIGGILTITVRNVVYCAVWLITTLLGVAGLYLLQRAEFLAGVQIIVYIGGIMVLYMFVIMLVPVGEESRQRRFRFAKVVCPARRRGIGRPTGRAALERPGVVYPR